MGALEILFIIIIIIMPGASLMNTVINYASGGRGGFINYDHD